MRRFVPVTIILIPERPCFPPDNAGSPMEINALAGPFGAEIQGLDLAAPLTADEREAANRASPRTWCCVSAASASSARSSFAPLS